MDCFKKVAAEEGLVKGLYKAFAHRPQQRLVALAVESGAAFADVRQTAIQPFMLTLMHVANMILSMTVLHVNAKCFEQSASLTDWACTLQLVSQ